MRRILITGAAVCALFAATPHAHADAAKQQRYNACWHHINTIDGPTVGNTHFATLAEAMGPKLSDSLCDCLAKRSQSTEPDEATVTQCLKDILL
jgi:hypothetical protein